MESRAFPFRLVRDGPRDRCRGLHFMHYNFARPHKTLTKKYGKPTTPAMAAGIATYPWSLTQIAELLD
jgi:hypothetical protein